MKRAFETEIEIPLPPSRAIRLFTPKGEEAWVPGWMPRYVEPVDGETVAGMVFETGEGEERTIWTCLEWSPESGYAAYLRVVPGSRVSRVHVACRADGGKSSRVSVRYVHVAITPQGEAWLERMTQEAFEAEIGAWQRHILSASRPVGRPS
ncbi:MAG: SRPBCC family protein [Pseudomonadota bacterium]|nr:SRPBCC family protein [Pseudomonadota bacterium]